MNFDATLWTPEAFFHKQDIYTWIFGIALGVIVVMAAYNLLISLMAREPMFRRPVPPLSPCSPSADTFSRFAQPPG